MRKRTRSSGLIVTSVRPVKPPAPRSTSMSLPDSSRERFAWMARRQGSRNLERLGNGICLVAMIAGSPGEGNKPAEGPGPNCLERSCPGAAGGSLRILAHCGGRGALHQARARRVSISELFSAGRTGLVSRPAHGTKWQASKGCAGSCFVGGTLKQVADVVAESREIPLHVYHVCVPMGKDVSRHCVIVEEG